jgi:hypothetical protein
MLGSNLLSLPVRGRGLGIVDLQAIHSNISFAGVGVAGDDAGESDESASVLRPALQAGKVEEGEMVTLDDLFAGAGGHGLWEKFSGFGEQWNHFKFVEKTLRGFEIHEDADAVGELVEGGNAESELHAGFGAELIDEELRSGVTFYVLEKEGGATGLATFQFADAVGDFGDFENGIDLGLDAFEFAGAVERGDPLTEVIEGQVWSPENF